MEELSAKRTLVRKEGTRDSYGNSPASDTDELRSIVVQRDASSHSCDSSNLEWLRSLSSTDVSKQRSKIPKVPSMLREIKSNKKCYDPLVVSIGPYHHGKPELEPMEKFKILFAKQYAEKSKVPVFELYEKVAAVDARKCYAEGTTECFDDKSFAKMMFLDGCFVLQFIFCDVIEGDEKKLKMNIQAGD